MKLDSHTHQSIFDELKPEWNDLLERSETGTIFSTWEWQSIWWDAYKPGELWIVTCRDDDGTLLGIAPWFIDSEGTIRAIGCEDVTDYLDVIIDKTCTGAVLNCFSYFLAQHHDDYKAIALCNIPKDSPTMSIFPETLRQHNFSVEFEQLDVCPLIQLPDDWEAYLSLLDKKQRHELRRKIRRMNGVPQTVDWYIVDDSHNLDEQIEIFLKLMASSDVKKQEFLRDENNLKFFKNIVPVIYQKGWLQLNFLTVDGEPSAAYLNFDYKNRIMVYNSGLAPEPYGHLSPGIVLLAHNIRYAIENDYEVFDFLRGDETYKYHMGGKDTSVHLIKAVLS